MLLVCTNQSVHILQCTRNTNSIFKHTNNLYLFVSVTHGLAERDAHMMLKCMLATRLAVATGEQHQLPIERTVSVYDTRCEQRPRR